MDGYTKLRVLGEGAYGRVYLAREKRPPRRLVCVKQYFASVPVKSSQNEIHLLQRVDHPNIVRFLDASELAKTQRWVAMEFCPGGDLRQFLKQRPTPLIHEDRVWYWIVQLCLALDYLHTSTPRIWHRDLKTSNVFLSNAGSLVLGDLGIAREASTDLATTVIGTPLYMAPEIWDGRPYDGACDLWAFGCMIYEICTGKTPFEDAKSTPALIKRACEGKYAPLPSAKWSSRLRKLVDDLLNVDPTKRPTTTMILRESENQVHVRRYVQDLIDAGRKTSNRSQAVEAHLVLRTQLQSLGIPIDSPADEEKLVAVDPKSRSPSITVSEGTKFHQMEREQRLRLQREHERHEQPHAALRHMHELQHDEPRVGNSTNTKEPRRVVVAAVDPEWKAPVQTDSFNNVARPLSASPRTEKPRVSPIELTGIPLVGVPLTRQAKSFVTTTQSPLCRDVRVLRKQEASKAAVRYKTQLDVKFNSKPENPNLKDDMIDGLVHLEAALRAQLQDTK